MEDQSGWRGSGGRLIKKILLRDRVQLASIVAATLGVYASSLAVPVVTQHIIDGITSAKPASFILVLGAIVVVLACTDVVLTDMRRSMVIKLGQRLDRHISLEIMRHVLGSRADTGNQNTGEILNRTEQTNKLKDFLIDRIPGALFDIGGALIAAIIIFAYSIPCGLAILVLVGASFLFAKAALRGFYETVALEFKLNNDKQGFLAETVGGLSTIRALSIEQGRFRLWAEKIKNVLRIYGNTEHMLRRFHSLNRITQHLMTLAVVGIGGYQMLHGSLTVGELFAILMLAGKISTPLLNISDITKQYQEVAVAVDQLGYLLDVPADRANVVPPLRRQLTGDLIFRNVTYCYSGRENAAIANLSLAFPPVGLIAIVGRNGSGKTTLLQLVQGLLRDFEGGITLGGEDIRSYHPRWLRSQMAVVNQDTILFAGTVRDNVSCWRSEVSDIETESALRIAGALEFVQLLPENLNARLQENGANLSGGQRQRLAIARAIAKNPSIILLDEPTAFLDAEAAVNLEQQLYAWGEGRLMIMVTHHLAAARLAESIILLDGGCLVAEGSHGDLLQSSTLYQSLWKDYLRGTGVSQSN